MTETTTIERLTDFVERVPKIGILSTKQVVVNYSGDLYNVDGSTEDPKDVDGYEDKTWKYILEQAAGLADSNCYVTNSTPPDDTSHPTFSVGGHMTPNSDGVVEHGNDTYLMPLCHWHNNPARNGVAFEHEETKMIILSGYMQGETALTFMMRQIDGSKQPFSCLLYTSPSPRDRG